MDPDQKTSAGKVIIYLSTSVIIISSLFIFGFTIESLCYTILLTILLLSAFIKNDNIIFPLFLIKRPWIVLIIMESLGVFNIATKLLVGESYGLHQYFIVLGAVPCAVFFLIHYIKKNNQKYNIINIIYEGSQNNLRTISVLFVELAFLFSFAVNKSNYTVNSVPNPIPHYSNLIYQLIATIFIVNAVVYMFVILYYNIANNNKMHFEDVLPSKPIAYFGLFFFAWGMMAFDMNIHKIEPSFYYGVAIYLVLSWIFIIFCLIKYYVNNDKCDKCDKRKTLRFPLIFLIESFSLVVYTVIMQLFERMKVWQIMNEEYLIIIAAVILLILVFCFFLFMYMLFFKTKK